MSTQTHDFDTPDDGFGEAEDPADTTQRERASLSVMHLVMGLVFLGIAGLWGLHAADVIGSVDVEWLVPLVFVVAGAAGLLASVAKGVGGRAST